MDNVTVLLLYPAVYGGVLEIIMYDDNKLERLLKYYQIRSLHYSHTKPQSKKNSISCE